MAWAEGVTWADNRQDSCGNTRASEGGGGAAAVTLRSYAVTSAKSKPSGLAGRGHRPTPSHGDRQRASLEDGARPEGEAREGRGWRDTRQAPSAAGHGWAGPGSSESETALQTTEQTGPLVFPL